MIKRLQSELETFRHSKKREEMFLGDRYYKGNHDILSRERTALGEEGKITYLHNLPNNQVVDNQYARIVDQKVNYLLANKPSFFSNTESLSSILDNYITREFLRTIRCVGESMLNHGITYLHVYFDKGELAFKHIPATEIIPFWTDASETNLDAVGRLFKEEHWQNGKKTYHEFVDVYDDTYIYHYEIVKGHLRLLSTEAHFSVNGKDGSWGKVPFVAFKANSKKQPLISKLKSLQDAINEITCDFLNHLQEDARNTILVLLNYEGTDLGEFRKNLSTYGAVKISTVDNTPGDVKTLHLEFDVENYQVALSMLKKAMFENGRGLDIRSEQMSNNPNQMNIETVYADLDLDANGIENELQASFEELFTFIKIHEGEKAGVDYTDSIVHVIFNRDILINESEAIENCQNSEGIIDDEIIRENHPWII